MIFFLCLDTWFSDFMTFFSCLDARKEGKRRSRRQGRQPNWGPSTILDVPGQTSPPSAEGLSFFCFFSFLKERKEDPIRKSSKDSWSSFCVLTHDFLTPWSSFLALMQEKKQKKIKASGTPAKFGWVHVGISPFGFELDFVFIWKQKVSSQMDWRPFRAALELNLEPLIE